MMAQITIAGVCKEVEVPPGDTLKIHVSQNGLVDIWVAERKRRALPPVRDDDPNRQSKLHYRKNRDARADAAARRSRRDWALVSAIEKLS